MNTVLDRFATLGFFQLKETQHDESLSEYGEGAVEAAACVAHPCLFALLVVELRIASGYIVTA